MVCMDHRVLIDLQTMTDKEVRLNHSNSISTTNKEIRMLLQIIFPVYLTSSVQEKKGVMWQKTQKYFIFGHKPEQPGYY